DAEAALEVFGMDGARPSVAEQIVDASPRVRRPRGTEPVVGVVEPGAPDQDRRRFEQTYRVLAVRDERSVALRILRFSPRGLRLTCQGKLWLPVASTSSNRGDSGGKRH